MEFPRAAYRSKDWGSSVHRNYSSIANNHCDRGSRLGQAELNPNASRPNFSSNTFCKTCHLSGGPQQLSGDEITRFDLSLDALAYASWHDATDDRRRQPLFWDQPYDEIVWDGAKNVRLGCGVGFHEIGRFGTCWGKVNVHRNVDGNWTHDTDCSSGANIKNLGYCQKFWPDAVSLHRTVLGPEKKPFATGGCGATYDNRGHEEWVCCEAD